MEGNVLVCVANVSHAEKLIKKGSRLAEVFGVKCFVFTKESEPHDDLNYDLVHRKKTVKDLCKKYDVPYFYADNEKRKFVKVIHEVVESNKISHILIGLPLKSTWSLFGEESIVNDLFVNLSDIDLHIVEVDNNEVSFNEEYEKGIRLPIFEVGEKKKFRLEEDEEGTRVEGIYFQSRSTEFENGVLKIKKDGEVTLYKVVDGEIIDLDVQKED